MIKLHISSNKKKVLEVVIDIYVQKSKDKDDKFLVENKATTSIYLYKGLYTNNYRSFICYIPKLETTQMSTREWIYQTVVYLCNVILLRSENKWAIDTLYNVVGSQNNYAELRN